MTTDIPSGPSTQPARIYVVDDDQAVRDAMCLLLTTNGWHPIGCDTAEDFLSRYAAGPAQCLILDIQLPGRNGIELQALLRSRGDTVPVIIVSAHHDHPSLRQARADGALAVLKKPFDHDHLMEWVSRALALGA